MRYFKVRFGYEESQYISISEEELPKALAMFISQEGRGVFEDGAVRGRDIIRIEPDYNRTMGWNKNWKMEEDDWVEVRPLVEKHREVYGEAKMLAEHCIRTEQPQLLTLPLSQLRQKVGLLGNPAPEVSDGVKELAAKFKV